jgi:hypothetical protein
MKNKLIFSITFFYIFLNTCFSQVTVLAPPDINGLCPGGNGQNLGSITIKEQSLKDFALTAPDGTGRFLEYYQITLNNPNFEFENAGTLIYAGVSGHNDNGSHIIQPQILAGNKSIYFSYKMFPVNALPDWDTDKAAFIWSGIKVKALSTAAIGQTATITRSTYAAGTNATQIGNAPNPSAGTQIHATVKAGGFDVNLIPNQTIVCSGLPVTLTATPTNGSSYVFEIENSSSPGGWKPLAGLPTPNNYICNVPTTDLINTSGANIDANFRVRVTRDGCTMTAITKVVVMPAPFASDQLNDKDYNNDEDPITISTEFPIVLPAFTSITYSGNGVIVDKFYPASFTEAVTNYTIYYTLEKSGCKSTTQILVSGEVKRATSPPPAFVSSVEAMPFCEIDGNKQITVSLGSNYRVMSVSASPPSAIVTTPNLGSESSTFAINPSIHTDYSITLNVLFLRTSGFVPIPEFLSGKISIYPGKTPTLTGFPWAYTASSLPLIYRTSICNSNDSTKLFATPGSEIKLYKVLKTEFNVPDKYVPIAMTSDLVGSPSGDGKLDNISFVSNEIYRRVLHSRSDSMMMVKVINNGDDDDDDDDDEPTSDCIGELIYAVDINLNTPNDIKLNIISQPPFCIGDSLEFEVTANQPQPYILNFMGNVYTVYERYSWYYGDGKTFLSDNSRTMKYVYNQPGEYSLRFTGSRSRPYVNYCPVDTIAKIVIGVSPKSEFFVKDNFAPNPIYLKNTSTYNKGGSSTTKDSISTWHWHFGDGIDKISHKDTNGVYNYNYIGNTQPYKVYPISLVTTTDVGCKDSTTKYVPYFPLKVPVSTPYTEDFNGPSIGWVDKGQFKHIKDSSSWRNIEPNGTIINSTVNGKAWITSKVRLLDDTAGYYKNENSWVESPVFDFNPLKRPMISFDTWALTENQLDGANLQYCLIDTTFGDESWVTIGSPKIGLNWYNSSIIISKGLPDNKFDAGWTGFTGKSWTPSSYYLDNVKAASVGKKVRFRISFNSNADNAPGIYDGFAFDNILIGERNRMVLIEELVNVAENDPEVEAIAVDPQALNIKYFVGHAGVDPINKDNKADPSARALLYGVDDIPRAVVDGIMFENKPFKADNWGPEDYTLRTLSVSPFDIDITPSVVGGALSVNSIITKNSTKVLTGPFVVQIAMVEKTLKVGATTFKNVHRKFLPNAAGNRVEDSGWGNAGKFSVTQLWNPTVAPKENDTIRIIVFIQHENSKEVYQAGFKDVPYSVLKDLTVNNASNVRTSNGLETFDFNVYPNPSNGDVNISLGEMFDKEIHWSILNNLGNTIKDGGIQENVHIQRISTFDLPSGIYLMKLEVNGQEFSKRFVIAK